MQEFCVLNAESSRSGQRTLDRRSVLIGVTMLISSAALATAQGDAPKLIVLPKGVTSPIRFRMRSPEDPHKIIALTNIPLEGFLVCNGAAISRTDYKELFGIIGTRYGTGDGKTTFGLPHYPVQYSSGRPISGMAICPSSRFEAPVGVVVPFGVSHLPSLGASRKS